MPRVTKSQQQESQHYLTDPESYGIKPGDTIYTSHHNPETYLKLFVVKTRADKPAGPDNPPRIVNITWYAARALGISPKDKHGEWYLRNPVYGMDRGFDVVYRLSATLFRDMPEEERAKHSPFQGSTDAGYLLEHRWL